MPASKRTEVDNPAALKAHKSTSALKSHRASGSVAVADVQKVRKPIVRAKKAEANDKDAGAKVAVKCEDKAADNALSIASKQELTQIKISWKMFQRDSYLGKGAFGDVLRVRCLESTCLSSEGTGRLVMNAKAVK